MIEREGGKLLFVCDECNEAFESKENDGYGQVGFNITWGAAKDEGWRARKIDNDWVHTCPDCAKTIQN